MNKKKLFVIGLPILAICVLALGGYQAWRMTPPAMPETVEDVEALFASGRYQRLSNAEQRPYLEHVNEMWGKLETDEERKRLGRLFQENPETGQDAMEQGIRTFHVMLRNLDKPARDAMLDMWINRSESSEGRQQRQEQQAQRNTPEGKEKEEEGRRWMMQWMDEGDPQAMGYGSEFFKMIRERREERNLPPF